MAASLKDQIEDLVSKISPGSIVGLDIGAHSIKVCEVSGSLGKLKVDKFAAFMLSEAALIEDEVQKPSEIVEGIIEVMKRAGIKSKVVCLGLFGPNTMTKRLNVPEGSKEEIEDHVMWESEQYITFGADESMIDFFILGENEGGGNDTLVAAAKNDVIESYTELLSEAKLTPKVVDLNVIALTNVFEEAYKDNLEDLSTGTLLIDMGAQTTKIVVYRKGGPIFTKELAIGGGLITEEIQRQMGVSYEEAEDLKTTFDENGNLPQEILNIINAQLDNQIAEIRKNINFYVTKGSADKVNYCYVTGGSSLLPGLVERISQAADLPVERLNLFSKIKIDEKKFDKSIDDLNAVMPIVLGLAMRKLG